MYTGSTQYNANITVVMIVYRKAYTNNLMASSCMTSQRFRKLAHKQQVQLQR